MFYSKQRRIDALEIENQMLREEITRLKKQLEARELWKTPVYQYRTHNNISKKYKTPYICVRAEKTEMLEK